ncbi:MAG: hypothetical protein AAF456_18720 [Planctomycetota bacterium]
MAKDTAIVWLLTSYFAIWLAQPANLYAQSADASETTTLSEMLVAVQTDANVSKPPLPLEQDWIGDIFSEDGAVTRLRLEKGRIVEGAIVLLRTYPSGRYRGSDAPVYVNELPPIEQLRDCETLDEVKQMLGDGQPSFSGWGGPNGIHSSHSWVCFGIVDENCIAYLSVVAHTSSNERQSAEGIIQIDGMLFRRGELRPADPDCADECELYLSGAEMFAAEERTKAEARLRYPEPLRDLVRISEHPDDSDLTHLSNSIQAIRNNPDPLLIQQLVREMHEGTLRIRSLVEQVLIGERLPGIQPWDTEQQAIAVNAFIDALPGAEELARVHLVEIILRLCGGGSITVDDNDVHVTLGDDGYTLAISNALRSVPMTHTQDNLRHLFEKSQAVDDRSPSP